MKSRWIALFFALAAVSAVDAHHSFAAQFDRDRPVVLEGRVIRMEWSNPHAWVHIEVTAENGEKQSWALETGAAANVLIRRGWRPAHLPEGTHVVVKGWMARNTEHTANIREIALDDGTKLLAGSADTTPNYSEE